MIICFAHGGRNTFKSATSASFIELQQHGFDRFTLVYGLSVKAGLTYDKACTELGAAIMHFQACEGTLDNRTRSEAREAGESAPQGEHYRAEPVKAPSATTGYLHHGKGTQGPFRTESVPVRTDKPTAWQAYFEGRWRRVYFQAGETYIHFGADRIAIQIEGV